MAAHAFSFEEKAVSPWLEMGAYEALWDQKGASFKAMAQRFAAHPGALPSDFVPDAAVCQSYAEKTVAILKSAGVNRFGVRINGAGEYPLKLRDAEFPIELLYYQGKWDLVETRCVAIVGARKATKEGMAHARLIGSRLAEEGFTIVSGLAAGIDTAAHGGAIQRGLPTIAVIGTPLSVSYPKENIGIQRFIARDNLLISQVPVCSYKALGSLVQPKFFPERNITMSALTEATIIVEASDTSGTLTQAKAAMKQGRKLFILESCFRDASLKWPRSYENRLGALRVANVGEILKHLA